MTPLSGQFFHELTVKLMDALQMHDQIFGVFIIDLSDPDDMAMAYITEKSGNPAKNPVEELRNLNTFMVPEEEDAKRAALAFHGNGICNPTHIGIVGPVTLDDPTEVGLCVVFLDIESGVLYTTDYHDGGWTMIPAVPASAEYIPLAQQLAAQYREVEKALAADMAAAGRGEFPLEASSDYVLGLRAAVKHGKTRGPRILPSKVLIDGNTHDCPSLMYREDGKVVLMPLSDDHLAELLASGVRTVTSGHAKNGPKLLLFLRDLLNEEDISAALDRAKAIEAGEAEARLMEAIFGKDAAGAGNGADGQNA